MKGMKGGFILGIGVVIFIVVILLLLVVMVCTVSMNSEEFYCKPFSPVVDIVRDFLGAG
jgi:hypothetical protein